MQSATLNNIFRCTNNNYNIAILGQTPKHNVSKLFTQAILAANPLPFPPLPFLVVLMAAKILHS